MSNISSFDYGYGVYVSNVEYFDMLKYLHSHQETMDAVCGKSIHGVAVLHEKYKNAPHKFREYISEAHADMHMLFNEIKGSEYESAYNYDYDDAFNILMEIVTSVLSAETGMGLYYSRGQSDIGSRPAIILKCLLPWQFTEVEKHLTREDFDRLFGKHIGELGLPEEDIEEIGIEYCR